MKDISMIAAIGKRRELGKDNQLLWHIPEDLKFFKETTQNKPIVMGKNTYLSLPKLLPQRKHIVLTHQEIKNKEVMTCHDLNELMAYIERLNQEIMVIGGAKVYEQMLPFTTKIYLTEIEKTFEADTYFPDFPKEEWQIEELCEKEFQDMKYKRLLYTRKH